MRVFVYRNVRRRDFSVRALDGPDRGRVILHVEAVEVLNAEFRVSEAGRQRVLRTGQKNVHAGVVGTLGRTVGVGLPANGAVLTRYDPFTGPAFMAGDRAVRRARRVVLAVGSAWSEAPE